MSAGAEGCEWCAYLREEGASEEYVAAAHAEAEEEMAEGS